MITRPCSFLCMLSCRYQRPRHRPRPATGQKPFEPQVGQAGKDVVWVPTPQAVVDKMLDLTKVTQERLRDGPRLG